MHAGEVVRTREVHTESLPVIQKVGQ